ncbi:MAG: hypothetical protein IPH04_02685 [Saprospirales bacterium]|nr:hypothetical protein [Saprospirales bacterium]
MLTDGHAWDGMTTFYDRDEDLAHIDWDMVKTKAMGQYRRGL